MRQQETSNSNRDDEGEHFVLPADLPNEILSNRAVVHRILLTDPADFEALSWDGAGARPAIATPTPGEFLSSFARRRAPGDRNGESSVSMEDLPGHIAETMRAAFFDRIADEMERGDYESAKGLLGELHGKMRSLLPNRKDLHSRIDDGDVSACSTARDVLRVLIRSGRLLANHLESPARAPTTLELIESLEATGAPAPYGIESEEVLTVASVAYVLRKAELCQVDVSNYKLSRAAPLLHLAGRDYEREHFRKTFGDYGPSTTADELRRMLPATWEWIRGTRALHGDDENLTPHSNLERKMKFLKGRGFVDGILFATSQLALPEIFSLDAEGINHIRNEARRCVIASALDLHARNVSGAGTSAIGPSAYEGVDAARRELSSTLRKRHFRQSELESDVVDAAGAMAKALAGRDLAEGQIEALKNHTLAVLRGEDPVLKLLDDRVRGFFRFACGWEPYPARAPSEMKTGRPVPGDGRAVSGHGIRSIKAEFSSAAEAEAGRLGFAHFGPELAEAGREARGVVALACSNFGQDILCRFLSIAGEGG